MKTEGIAALQGYFSPVVTVPDNFLHHSVWNTTWRQGHNFRPNYVLPLGLMSSRAHIQNCRMIHMVLTICPKLLNLPPRVNLRYSRGNTMGYHQIFWSTIVQNWVSGDITKFRVKNNLKFSEWGYHQVFWSNIFSNSVSGDIMKFWVKNCLKLSERGYHQVLGRKLSKIQWKGISPSFGS